MKYLAPLIILLSACGGSESRQGFSPMDSALRHLEACYYKKDTACFDAFFEKMRFVPPEAKPNSLLKAETYALFEEFYQPQKLSLLGDWINDVESINTGQPYLLLQGCVAVEVDGMADTVRDFRPLLGGGVPPGRGVHLYWQPDYDSLMVHFLNQPAWANYTNANEKAGWLRRWASIIGRDSCWHIVSSPEIRLISFNKKMDSARVTFRAGIQYGEALMHVKNYRWVLVSKKEIPDTFNDCPPVDR